MPPKKINDDVSEDDEWSPDQLLASRSNKTDSKVATTTSKSKKPTTTKKRKLGLSASNAGVQTLVASSKRVDLEGLVMRCYEVRCEDYEAH